MYLKNQNGYVPINFFKNNFENLEEFSLKNLPVEYVAGKFQKSQVNHHKMRV